MADQTKQSILSGQGNTQIIGVPYGEFIAEIWRRDAESASRFAEGKPTV
ncbi:hypothetical protein HIMB11_01272 [Rhodobacteraceae bacterium HIMB11]|nr:hypothetical protein HIMB11_01272 [Rhodobacteraceae bacterium HIMB11]